MKFEALMLCSLCAIGMLVCALVLGAMLLATPTPTSDKVVASTPHTMLAVHSQAAAAAISAPAHS